jgi:hypothetical protein
MRFLDKHSTREKHLRRLEREERRLWQAYRATPLVPLEQPYQRGWVKTYVLEPRVLQRPDAHIFREMLRAVNHRATSSNREFLSRRGFPIILRPRGIGVHQWTKLAWPASYQRFFRLGHWRIEDEVFRRPERFYRPTQRLWQRGYKLAVDWWLKEDIQPLMITHRRAELPDVTSRLAEIDAFMSRTCGREQLNRLHGYSERYWRCCVNHHVEDRAVLAHREQLGLFSSDDT